MVEQNVENIHRAVNNGGEQAATDTMACYFENRDADDLMDPSPTLEITTATKQLPGPIGSASIFCNAPVLCRMLPLKKAAPALDIAQGGFCENRGVLDQVSCLAGAAYDTVNRNRFWSAVQYLALPPLLALLKKALFDDIHIEALLSHVVSCQFSPRTDVS
ncbi:hypothetical protein G6F43_011671 [Rhizopus delemar]|nr:hypothetical protein G6F43_011671 [Rhizopus delemar]